MSKTTVEQEAKRLLKSARAVSVLTGAGVSAESGIPIFRGEEGLWRSYHPEDLATPQAYARDPELVWVWYKMRLNTVLAAEPNEAHKVLAGLEPRLTLVTQNVDGLHARAGSTPLELHGNLTHSRCEQCGGLDELEPDFKVPPNCSRCGERARPNVVWFGEGLPGDVFDKAVRAFANVEVALIIGTSGMVEPAASLARLAKSEGAFVIEINPEMTPLSELADLSLRTSAVLGLRRLLEPA